MTAMMVLAGMPRRAVLGVLHLHQVERQRTRPVQAELLVAVAVTDMWMVRHTLSSITVALSARQYGFRMERKSRTITVLQIRAS